MFNFNNNSGILNYRTRLSFLRNSTQKRYMFCQRNSRTFLNKPSLSLVKRKLWSLGSINVAEKFQLPNFHPAVINLGLTGTTLETDLVFHPGTNHSFVETIKTVGKPYKIINGVKTYPRFQLTHHSSHFDAKTKKRVFNEPLDKKQTSFVVINQIYWTTKKQLTRKKHHWRDPVSKEKLSNLSKKIVSVIKRENCNLHALELLAAKKKYGPCSIMIQQSRIQPPYLKVVFHTTCNKKGYHINQKPQQVTFNKTIFFGTKDKNVIPDVDLPGYFNKLF